MSENTGGLVRRITLPFIPSGETPYIFASYAHSDSYAVFPLLRRLHEEGYNVRYDDGTGFEPNGGDSVREDIEHCCAFIYFASSLSVRCRYIIDNELDAAKKSLDPDRVLPLYLDSGLIVPDEAARLIPAARYDSIDGVIAGLKALGIESFGEREAEPAGRDVPVYWFDDYMFDPSAGTDSIVYAEEEPYACLCCYPGELCDLDVYGMELYYAGYNVRSFDSDDTARREAMLTAPGCALVVPVVTTLYAGSEYIGSDLDAAKRAGKPIVAVYIPEDDEDGYLDDEEEQTLPDSAAGKLTAAKVLSFNELTGKKLLSELGSELRTRKCFAGRSGGRILRRSFEIPDFLYEFTGCGKRLILTKYTGRGRDIVIRKSYGGFRVDAVGEDAFAGCRAVSVTIPDGVTSIEEGAFRSCRKLVSVTIPDTVSSIGDGAFKYCWNLETVTIPCGVRYIGSEAFRACFSLTSVTIPDGVYHIGDSAFEHCTGLVSVTIPDSVVTIGYHAFDSCESLTSISFPDSVVDMGAFVCYLNKSLVSAKLPEGITSLPYAMFYGCRSLASIRIPDSVTYISSNTFSGCEKLASVNIPDGVETIGSFAFSRCNELVSITIPDSVTELESGAFYECDNLEAFIVPSGKLKLTREPFIYIVLYDCPIADKLTVYCPEDSETWDCCGEDDIPHEPIEDAPVYPGAASES